MRNIEILKEILKLTESELPNHPTLLWDTRRLATIRELIEQERPMLVTEQKAHDKDQLKLEGIE
jgi:hypothetical protein